MPSPRGLKRRKAFREITPRFRIACEGTVTERVYFSELARTLRVSVEILKNTGSPLTISKALVAHKKKGRRGHNSWDAVTSYWAVFDRDEHPYVPESMQLLQDNQIGCAFSNPCFELWLILHHKDHDAPQTRQQMQKMLEGLDPDYDRTGGKRPNAAELIKHVEDAEKRAELMSARRKAEAADFGNPSTSVWLLTRKMKAAAPK